MKKNIIVYSLISGVILAAFILTSVSLCYNSGNFEGSMVLGYASMILAFSLIFVGIKNYRDKFNGGFVSFGKAFTIGLYITLIASTMYVVVWLIDYYFFVPDFMDKYSAHVMREAAASGSTRAEIADKTAEITTMKNMYENPLYVILFTYFEVVPVGLVVSIISALILKRKPNLGTAV